MVHDDAAKSINLTTCRKEKSYCSQFRRKLPRPTIGPSPGRGARESLPGLDCRDHEALLIELARRTIRYWTTRLQLRAQARLRHVQTPPPIKGIQRRAFRACPRSRVCTPSAIGFLSYRLETLIAETDTPRVNAVNLQRKEADWADPRAPTDLDLPGEGFEESIRLPGPGRR
ncbi:hypothetical protein NL676_007046 [Syzygium grande]|nr:hypothetical protein NL676_007046 [Syzygium grande]